MQKILLLLFLTITQQSASAQTAIDSIDAIARGIDTSCTAGKRITGSAHIHGRYTGLAHADSNSIIRKLELRFDDGSMAVLYTCSQNLVKIVEDGLSYYPANTYKYGTCKISTTLLLRLEEDAVILQSILALLALH